MRQASSVRRLFVLLALGLIAAVVSLSLRTNDLDEATVTTEATRLAARSSPFPEGIVPEEIATETAKLMEQGRQDGEQPEYIGTLGDFELVLTEEEAQPHLLCAEGIRQSAGHAGELRDVLESELNQEEMREQLVCSDGTVVATYSMELGRRSYFYGLAKVHVDVPRDRLSLIDVDGRPTLLVRPRATPGSYFAFSILRKPSMDEPGILISLMAHDEERVLELVRSALGQ